MNKLSIDQLEHMVLISQITDSYMRSEISPIITSFNKAAVASGSPKMSAAYLLEKRMPSFHHFLKDMGILLEADLRNSLRISYFYLDVDGSNVKDPSIKNARTYLTIGFLFRKYLSTAVGKKYKVFNDNYEVVLIDNTPCLTLDGRSDIIPLDLTKFLILLQEI